MCGAATKSIDKKSDKSPSCRSTSTAERKSLTKLGGIAVKIVSNWIDARSLARSLARLEGRPSFRAEEGALRVFAFKWLENVIHSRQG